MNHQGLINRYRKFLPLNKSAKVITLYEGQTPLLPLENIPLCLEKNITFDGWLSFLNRDVIGPLG